MTRSKTGRKSWKKILLTSFICSLPEASRAASPARPLRGRDQWGQLQRAPGPHASSCWGWRLLRAGELVCLTHGSACRDTSVMPWSTPKVQTQIYHSCQGCSSSSATHCSDFVSHLVKAPWWLIRMHKYSPRWLKKANMNLPPCRWEDDCKDLDPHVATATGPGGKWRGGCTALPVGSEWHQWFMFINNKWLKLVRWTLPTSPSVPLCFSLFLRSLYKGMEQVVNGWFRPPATINWE